MIAWEALPARVAKSLRKQRGIIVPLLPRVGKIHTFDKLPVERAKTPEMYPLPSS